MERRQRAQPVANAREQTAEIRRANTAAVRLQFCGRTELHVHVFRPMRLAWGKGEFDCLSRVEITRTSVEMQSVESYKFYGRSRRPQALLGPSPERGGEQARQVDVKVEQMDIESKARIGSGECTAETSRPKHERTRRMNQTARSVLNVRFENVSVQLIA